MEARVKRTEDAERGRRGTASHAEECARDRKQKTRGKSREQSRIMVRNGG